MPLGLERARAAGFSLFVTEQHGRYLGELRLGDHYTVHPAFLHRSGRALHTASYIVDQGRQRIAARIECIHVFVSTDTRQSVAFTTEFAEALDRAVREDRDALDQGDIATGIWRAT